MIIAFTGKARSGKDTAARFLKDMGFVTTAFAEALKDSCMFKFGLSHEDVYTETGKERYVPAWDKTVREILQAEGTEATKPYWGDDFWIRRWRMDIEALRKQGISKILVTDLRFDNEAQAITDMGGKIIKLSRNNAGLEGSQGAHASERGISDQFVSKFIQNNGSVQDLEAAVIEYYQSLGAV